MLTILYYTALIMLLVLLGVLIYLRFLQSKIKYEIEYNKGIDSYVNGQYKTSIKYFKNAINLNASTAEPYYNLALTYMALEKFSEAEACFHKALEISQDDPDTYYNLGLLNLTQKKYNDASENFFKFISLRNDDPDSYYNLGLTLVELNKFQDAYENFNKAIELVPDNISYLFGIAKAYDRRSDTSGTQKDIDAAIESYKKLLEIEPKHEESNYRLAICFAKKGMWEESVNYCKKVIEINNQSAEAHNQLGLALYCRSDIDTAIIMYKKSINLDPNYAQSYYNLGYALEKQGNFKEAVDTFNKFIELSPGGEDSEEIKEHVRELKESIDIKLSKLQKKQSSPVQPLEDQAVNTVSTLEILEETIPEQVLADGIPEEVISTEKANVKEFNQDNTEIINNIPEDTSINTETENIVAIDDSEENQSQET